jgi:hypothetical protein
MLIDKFGQRFLKELRDRFTTREPGCELYLLVDGAFVSGIHKIFKEDEKRILFDVLPSCNDETRNISPFLILFNPSDRRQQNLLDRSSGWPMISLIETSESLTELFNRLAAWCVVEIDGERYNFRFADTRRLPSVIRNLTPEQRFYFTGPAITWSFMGRDGNLAHMEIASGYLQEKLADSSPTLQQSQFQALLDDSWADEILAIMTYRGERTTSTYYQRWVSVMAALEAANAARLSESHSVEWAIWCAKNHYGGDLPLAKILRTWCEDHAVVYHDKF